jgi:hypothetical protein
VPLLPRLNIQSKLIVLLLLVCISSIIAIAAIAYSTGKDALTQAIFNHLTSVRAAKRSEIESQFQLIRSQIINLSSDPSVVECMLGLQANFAAFTDSEVRPGWDEKLLTYYRDDFLPKLAQNTGKHPLAAFAARPMRSSLSRNSSDIRDARNTSRRRAKRTS